MSAAKPVGHAKVLDDLAAWLDKAPSDARVVGENAYRVIANVHALQRDDLADRVATLFKAVSEGEKPSEKCTSIMAEITRQLVAKGEGFFGPITPYINGTTLHFSIDPKGDRRIQVVVAGCFPYVNNSHTLTVQEHIYWPVETGKNKLLFSVLLPSHHVVPSLDKPPYLRASLQATRKSGYVFGWPTCEFPVLLPLRPAGPGNIEVAFIKPFSTKISNFTISGNTKEERTQAGTVSATEGWSIVPTTPHIQWTRGPEGDCAVEIVQSDTPDTVKYRGRVTVGHGKFQVVFTETRINPPTSRVERIRLCWGEKHTVKLENEETVKHVVLEDLNGKREKFAYGNASHHFLKLLKNTDGFHISIVDAKDVTDEMLAGEEYKRESKTESKDSKDAKTTASSASSSSSSSNSTSAATTVTSS